MGNAPEMAHEERSLAEISPLNSHPQMQSPLFSVLPPEIRNQIFELAVSEYEDTTRPYDPTDDYYRPGHCFPKVINTDLLLTCRRVYYETNAIPMRSATHHIWLGWTTMFRDPHRTPLRFPSLTRKHQTELNHVHVFAYPNLPDLSALISRQQFRPKHLTITVGWNYDWSSPNDEDFPMSLDADWVLANNTKLPDELEDVKIEFEALMRRKDELDRLVKIAMLWRFEMRDGTEMVADKSTSVRRWTRYCKWRGPVSPPWYDYHMVTVVWRRPISSSTKDED
ncbi:hypothetical protein H2199_000890 [Coniosporium tulheliwenetii]|uniref:Uncharacterized protein n=1 Tax=Coniosporium tulheliwenetii TaxID=3383036 RepID=A0ACC2ZN95_9PEZI|nr:hypothetical protein H2199_000890 [Cladosporium sp. JES 115]